MSLNPRGLLKSWALVTGPGSRGSHFPLYSVGIRLLLAFGLSGRVRGALGGGRVGSTRRPEPACPGGGRDFVVGRWLRGECGPAQSQAAGHASPMWSNHSWPCALKSTPHPCCPVQRPRTLRGAVEHLKSAWTKWRGPVSVNSTVDFRDPERDPSHNHRLYQLHVGMIIFGYLW